MKLFLIGKRGSITHWLEDCAHALAGDGHDVRVGSTRDPALHPAIDAHLAPLRARALAHRIRRFSPDLILAIGGFHTPLVILQTLAAMPGRAPFVGWVGDLFGLEASLAAAAFDRVAFTDSGLMARHRELGFATASHYLPHAADPFATLPTPTPRNATPLVFVGNPTPQRRAVVKALTSPITLYGPAWRAASGPRRFVRSGRVAAGALTGIYARHLAALNIRNEMNVLHGLNQRNFTPYLTATPVVSDNQPDLEGCFAPGAEALVYDNVAALNDLAKRLQREPHLAAKVGEAGRRRVMAEHTYGHRLAAILASL